MITTPESGHKITSIALVVGGITLLMVLLAAIGALIYSTTGINLLGESRDSWVTPIEEAVPAVGYLLVLLMLFLFVVLVILPFALPVVVIMEIIGTIYANRTKTRVLLILYILIKMIIIGVYAYYFYLQI